MQKSAHEKLVVLLLPIMMFVIIFVVAIIVPREIMKMDDDMIHVDKYGTIYGKIESNEDMDDLKKEWPRGVMIFSMSRHVCAESSNGTSCWVSDTVIVDTVQKRIWLGGRYMPYIRVR